MRRALLIAVVALAGIAVAVGVTMAASELTSEDIGLDSEPLTAGRELVPSTAARTTSTTRTQPRRTRTTTTARTTPARTSTTPRPPTQTGTTSTPPTTTDDDDDDSGHGRGRGRGGDDDGDSDDD